jgi:hypothetical protein
LPVTGLGKFIAELSIDGELNYQNPNFGKPNASTEGNQYGVSAVCRSFHLRRPRLEPRTSFGLGQEHRGTRPSRPRLDSPRAA